MGTTINPYVVIVSSGPCGTGIPPEPLWSQSFWSSSPRKIIVGYHLTIFVPHAVVAPLNSHHTQHFSVSDLTSYKTLLLAAPHITHLHCNNLHPVTLLPYVTDKVSNGYFMLMDHLLTPHNDLQEIPLGNTDFSWFTNGSYLKSDNGKYCAEYVIATPFDVVEVASLPKATSAQ